MTDLLGAARATWRHGVANWPATAWHWPGRATSACGPMTHVLDHPGGYAASKPLKPEDITIVTLDGDVLDGARPSSETRSAPGDLPALGGAGRRAHPRPQFGRRRTGLRSDAAGALQPPPAGRPHSRPCRTCCSGPTNSPTAVGAAVAEGFGTVLMRNHGAVSSARSVAEAVEHACLLEWLCDVYLAACSLGTPALLTDDDLQAVAAQSRRLVLRSLTRSAARGLHSVHSRDARGPDAEDRRS